MPRAGFTPIEIARRTDVGDLLDEPLGLVRHHDQIALGAAGDVVGPAGPGQPRFRQPIGVADLPIPDAGRVDVAELVDLRRADDPDIAAPGCDEAAQRVERGREARRVGRNTVALDAPGQAADGRGAVDAPFRHGTHVWRVMSLGEEARQHRQPDAENGEFAVADLPPRGDRHHLLAREGFGLFTDLRLAHGARLRVWIFATSSAGSTHLR